jgi:hypothetical protein
MGMTIPWMGEPVAAAEPGERPARSGERSGRGGGRSRQPRGQRSQEGRSREPKPRREQPAPRAEHPAPHAEKTAPVRARESQPYRDRAPRETVEPDTSHLPAFLLRPVNIKA